MSTERRYTVWGAGGLIDTLLTRDELVEVIKQREPEKNAQTVLDKAHKTLACKSGSLTIVVVSVPAWKLRSEQQGNEIKNPKVPTNNPIGGNEHGSSLNTIGILRAIIDSPNPDF